MCGWLDQITFIFIQKICSLIKFTLHQTHYAFPKYRFFCINFRRFGGSCVCCVWVLYQLFILYILLLSFSLILYLGTEYTWNNVIKVLSFDFVWRFSKLCTISDFCIEVSDDPHIIKTLSSLGELHFEILYYLVYVFTWQLFCVFK